MNENIRKKNQQQNERLKNKLKDRPGNPVVADRIPHDFIPWGVDQTQFQQEVIGQK